MARPLPPLFFSLLFILLARLASAQNSGFSFPTNGLSSSSLLLNPAASVSTSGVLTLDGSSSFAEALYKDSFSLVDLSFNTFFSVSANATYANGSFAFVIVPVSTFENNYEKTSNALAVVFNNTCYGFNDTTGPSDSWGGGPGRFRGGDGPFSGPSWSSVSVYAGGVMLPPTTLSSPYPWQNGPGWNDPEENWQAWPGSCSQQPSDSSLYTYEVAVQYNASAQQVTLALGSACFVTGQVAFTQDLSKVITKSAYVGFIASDGAVYNLSQWNFTSNATSSILSVIAASSASADSSSPSASSSKLHKGYVVGFTLLGGGVGMATLVGACFLYRKRRTGTTTRAFGAQTASFESTPTKGMMNTKVKPANEYDTSPLYPMQSRTSSTETASWLKPVLPR